MGSFLAARRRMMANRGRPMILRRLLTISAVSDVTLAGFLATFSAEQVGTGSIMQGDARVSIMNEEIEAATWPGPPRTRDQIMIDNRTWTVMGVSAVYDGPDIIGYDLFVRGG